MKFTIVVYQNNSSFYIGGGKTGLKGLDIAREQTGIKKLKKELVPAEYILQSVAPALDLTEEEARRYGGFEEETRQQISLTKEEIVPFIYKHVNFKTDETTGEIIWIEMLEKIDEDELKAYILNK